MFLVNSWAWTQEMNKEPEMIDVLFTAFLYVMSRWYRRAAALLALLLFCAVQVIQLLKDFGVWRK